MSQPGFSYGSAYADLDNDGRLDLVVNNIDGRASIYHNVMPTDDGHHALRVTLDGEPPNRRGTGATLSATVGTHKQYVYVSPYRGFMSSMDDRVHFGLGRARRVDSLEVAWPDGRRQLLTNVPADTPLVVRQRDATRMKRNPETDSLSSSNPLAFIPDPSLHLFTTAAHPPQYQQHPRSLVDFDVQPLLPYMVSRHGPAIAVGDVDGDGLDDLFVGGGNGEAGKLFLQKKDGSFVESNVGQPWNADKDFEDWDAVFFDANGDGLPDLYVASGGYHLVPESPLLQDRLYINQGGGHFIKSTSALPVMLASKSVVRVADFNGDGRPDLFVGGRLTPMKYPYPTRSYILRNDGDRFTDVTEQLAPELVHPGGMITDAAWVDYDGDGRLDLVTVGEWMPIQFFHNDGGHFTNATSSMHLPPSRGWWFNVAVGDFDHDGRPDIIAGNLGLNTLPVFARQRTPQEHDQQLVGITPNMPTNLPLVEDRLLNPINGTPTRLTLKRINRRSMGQGKLIRIARHGFEPVRVPRSS
jgi:hypothetical protein